MQRKEWTNLETRQLEVLCDLGAGVAYIAASLGMPVNVVLDKMQEVGLSTGRREVATNEMEAR